jgi:hypothetical protein
LLIILASNNFFAIVGGLGEDSALVKLAAFIGKFATLT